MNYTAKQIAKMIVKNLRALDDKKITMPQFHVVQRATWELADRGEPCVMDSECDHRVMAVRTELTRLGV